MKHIPTTEAARLRRVWDFGTASDGGQSLARGEPCWKGHAAGIERDRRQENSSASLPGPGPAGRHTPTQLQEKLTRGKLQLARGGDGAGRDPSSAVTENTRSKFLKAHHKLSSIWEPVFLAGPT